MNVDLSIILPCFNSERLIESRVREFESVLNCTRWNWEILLCDDGSQDETAVVCQRLAEESTRRLFIPSPVNRGRGGNVAGGVRQSRGRIVGFADVDSSTAAVYLLPAVHALENGFALAEASRSYKIVLSDLPFISHRLLAHVAYARLVSCLLGIRGHDTESGFKFFRREPLVKLLETTASQGWFWDTEIVAHAHRMNFPVAEIRSLFVRRKGMPSTVRFFRDSWHQGRNLLRFAWDYRRTHFRRPCCWG